MTTRLGQSRFAVAEGTAGKVASLLVFRLACLQPVRIEDLFLNRVCFSLAFLGVAS